MILWLVEDEKILAGIFEKILIRDYEVCNAELDDFFRWKNWSWIHWKKMRGAHRMQH